MIAPLAITMGDPAGIGPDLLLALPEQFPNTPMVFLADHQLLKTRASMLGLSANLPSWQPGDATPTQAVVWHHPMTKAVTAGEPDPANGKDILSILDTAVSGCLNNTFSAMITAPLAKHVVATSALPGFTGHTEYLADRAAVKKVVMMLACPTMRVALATTHLPLKDVASAITSENILSSLTILHHALGKHFGISDPSILVLGLNPHAGESGELGHEEIDILIPALDKLRQKGIKLSGPVPADTAFQPKLLQQHDAVFAMYHDQGLPVLKYAGFGEAVNITLGLPFVRTSVDHGTAFPLAGTGKANPDSLFAAVIQALAMNRSQSSNEPS